MASRHETPVAGWTKDGPRERGFEGVGVRTKDTSMHFSLSARPARLFCVGGASLLGNVGFFIGMAAMTSQSLQAAAVSLVS